jgi:hypothetical protein
MIRRVFLRIAVKDIGKYWPARSSPAADSGPVFIQLQIKVDLCYTSAKFQDCESRKIIKRGNFIQAQSFAGFAAVFKYILI